MTEGAWLSILIPVYNVAPYLEECVMSVLSQTDNRVEILLLDDASTDGSPTLIQELCDRYSDRIRLLRHDHNRGLSAARNSLLDAARGEYIWFLDSDDRILAGAVDKLRRIVSECSPDLILCDYRKRRFWRIKSFYGPTRQISCDLPKLIRGVFRSRKMYAWLKISRRTLWANDLKFPVGRCFEDVATTPWLLLRARNYYYVPRAWVFYRIRPGSIMQTVNRSADIFDEMKHRHLAQALLGYKDSLSAKIRHKNPVVDFAVADFCVKEFVKTGLRLTRARRTTADVALRPALLASYLSDWQQCSALPFEKMHREYIRRFRFIRPLLLRHFLRMANMGSGKIQLLSTAGIEHDNR